MSKTPTIDIDDAYASLESSIIDAMTWTPRILFPSPQLQIDSNKKIVIKTIEPHNESQEGKNSMSISVECQPMIDIVELLSIATTNASSFATVNTLLNYPPGAIFKFTGFKGIRDKQKLSSYIISTAQQHGTSLSNFTSKQSTSSSRLHMFILGCIHHRINKNLKKITFKDNQLQATGTICGREHQLSSVKGRSRCSNNSFANTTKAALGKGGHLIKSKRICPTSTDTQCMFKFCIFCSTEDECWYLATPSLRSNATLQHTNHIQLSGEHLCTHLKTLDSVIKDKVRELVDAGANNNVIANFVSAQSNFGINPRQIQHIREESINNILVEHEKHPKSSVDKLLSLFGSMDDVSYVYMMHSMTSGFVTYHKTRSESDAIRTKVAHMSDEDKKALSQMTNDEKKELEVWRQALKVGDSTEILVSFAWTHDYEKRLMLMFPEFWATDMTFGLNKERRQIVTICGIDGNNNSFTGLRVWMPSKQRIAYQWAIDNALPILIGETTTKRNQMIASDDELALVDAIKLAINSPDGSLRNSKFRKDYYHLVTKQWIAIVKTTKIKDIANCSDISDFIGQWIKSWFSYVNDENEFKLSYQ